VQYLRKATGFNVFLHRALAEGHGQLPDYFGKADRRTYLYAIMEALLEESPVYEKLYESARAMCDAYITIDPDALPTIRVTCDEAATARGITAICLPDRPELLDRRHITVPGHAAANTEQIYQRNNQIIAQWGQLWPLEFPLLFGGSLEIGHTKFRCWVNQFLHHADTDLPKSFDSLLQHLVLKTWVHEETRQQLAFERSLRLKGKSTAIVRPAYEGSWASIAKLRNRIFAVVREHGPPDIFLTITLNKDWDNISWDPYTRVWKSNEEFQV
jgi:hypothetical protein